MGISHSPSIARSGLILYVDMSNTQKSWKGRPVTNQFTVPSYDSNNNVTFSVQGTGTFQRVLLGTYDGYTITSSDVVYRYDLGTTGCHYHGYDVNITSGQTATFSFDYFVSQDAANYPTVNYLANLEGVVSGSISDTTSTIKGVWKRAQFTATASSTGTCRMLLYPGACATSYLASSGYILYKNPQVEFDAPGSTSSPYVSGTRSTAQALLDLTNGYTITATSATYTSDNTYSFNGTSDFMQTNLTTFGNNMSWEAWTYCTQNVSTYNMFMGRYLPYFSFYNGDRMYFSNNIGGTQQTISTAATLSLNTWYHSVFTTSYDNTNTTMSIYVNGVLSQSATFTGAQGNYAYNFMIGDGNNSANTTWYPFKGKVPMVRVYNRTLTAAEVKQNFEAQRTRFGV